jgi:GMP synthase-like glutamine amidotransferase
MQILFLNILTDDSEIVSEDDRMFGDVHGYAGNMCMAFGPKNIAEVADAGFSSTKTLEYCAKAIANGQYDGVVIGGSATDITRGQIIKSWQKLVFTIIRLAHYNNIPVLGLCGGHQYGARALTEHPDSVIKNPLGRNMGTSSLWRTSKGIAHPIFAGITNRTLFQWSHSCVVNRSMCKHEHFSLLASHPMSWCVAFQAGSFIGLQFHPEASVFPLLHGVSFIKRLAESRKQALIEEGFVKDDSDFDRFMDEDITHAPEGLTIITNWMEMIRSGFFHK